MNEELGGIFGRRLQQARIMRGLSLRGLAEALGGAVSHNALAKYESGKMMPGSDVLIRLSDTLAQPADFFFRPFRLQLKAIRFRRKSTLGVKRQAALREQAADFFERYRELEEIIGEVRRFQTVFPRHRPLRGAEEAENLANQLRQAWNLGADALPNLQELMEEKGLKVLDLESDDTDFDGLSADTEEGRMVVLASHLQSNIPRKRMTEAHEVAHAVVPVAEGVDERTEEAIARRFAGAFLMPSSSFREAFGGRRSSVSLGELIALKAQFGASILAIMKRAQQLELISAAYYEGFCKVASQAGWRSGVKEPGDDQWQGLEQSFRFERLAMRAVAEEKISAAKGATLLRISLDEFRARFRELVE